MAVGGSTTVPSWIQALASKYWNMCLFLYMCLRAQWWAHFKDLNNNSYDGAASLSAAAVPELHLKESCGPFPDYTPSLSFMEWLQPDPCCPCLPALVLSFLLAQQYIFSFEKSYCVFLWVFDNGFLPRRCLNFYFFFLSSTWWATLLHVSIEANYNHQGFLEYRLHQTTWECIKQIKSYTIKIDLEDKEWDDLRKTGFN